MSFKDFIKNELPSFNGEVNFKEDVLTKDKNQSEFTLSLPIYLKKIITKERIKTGKENLKAWETQLAKIHKVWGVPPEVIIAIWGIETNFGEKPIKISAQAHLQNFYKKNGFKSKGETYLEDGIPHIAMYLIF